MIEIDVGVREPLMFIFWAVIGEIKFFLGYSGWDKNQLENEITLSSWVVEKENGNGSKEFEILSNG